MHISQQQNRLYHAILRDAHEAPLLYFSEAPDSFNPPLVMFPHKFTIDEFKGWMKELDLGYPSDMAGVKVSAKDIYPDDLSRHIEWILNVCGDSRGPIDCEYGIEWTHPYIRSEEYESNIHPS